MSDLEEVLRDALRVDADRAPMGPIAWDPIRPLARPQAGTTRRVWAGLGLVATVAVAVIAVAVSRESDSDPQNEAVATADDDSTPTTSPTSPPTTSPPPQRFVPAGVEFRIDDLGESPDPASLPLAPQTLASLTRVIGIPDSAPLTTYRTLKYMGEQTASEFVCVSEQNSGAACGYDTPDGPPIVSGTATVANHVGPTDMFVWQNVPASAVYVAAIYNDGPPSWQQPVARVAAFPTKGLPTNLHPAGSVDYAIAYDANGNELGRAAFGDSSAVTPTSTAGAVPKKADISRSDFDLLVLYTDTTMQSCLDEARQNAAAQDDTLTWSICVVQVQALVQQAVDGLNPRFYDPATDTPQNPNPPFAVSNPADGG